MAGAFTTKLVECFCMMMITLVFQVTYNHELIDKKLGVIHEQSI